MSAGDRLRLAFVGLHPERRRRLEAELGSAAAVLRAVASGRISVGETARAAADVPAGQRRAQLARMGVEPVLRGGEGYPSHLAALPDAPDLLFCRGGVPAEPGVAVVGTRRASGYGLRLARAMGGALAEAGWPVVSGLARGVDGAAHQGTLDAGGVGVAVLGSGPDVWYPAGHRRLGEALVAAGGAVVTEYPPGTPPEGWRFPPRNRIISGLAAVVVVVEARVDGGALITARRGLEQGREVFAVPGDVDRESSVGCNLLIRDGAHPVLGPEDLVAAVSLVLGPPAAPPATGENQEPLLAALGPVGRTPDWLAQQLGLPPPRLLAEVARLEAAGRVRREGGLVIPAEIR